MKRILEKPAAHHAGRLLGQRINCVRRDQMEDTPQHIKNGADPGSPSRHLHSSPPRFLSSDEIEPDCLRCQRCRRSLLRHSPSLPGERSRRIIRGTELHAAARIETDWPPRKLAKRSLVMASRLSREDAHKHKMTDLFASSV